MPILTEFSACEYFYWDCKGRQSWLLDRVFFPSSYDFGQVINFKNIFSMCIKNKISTIEYVLCLFFFIIQDLIGTIHYIGFVSIKNQEYFFSFRS